MSDTQFVVKRNNKWAVIGANNIKATAIVPTQEEAIKIARFIAKHKFSEMRVQDLNGRFRLCNSYGNDPCPPKDLNR